MTKIEPEDQTVCNNCHRIVGRDEAYKHGCIICEEELDFKENNCKHCHHENYCDDSGQLKRCMKHDEL